VIRSFHDKGTEDVFHGRATKAARKTLPSNLLRVAQRNLDQLNQAAVLDDLRVPPGNQLEALKADRRGQHAIRVNDQFRVCFVWTETGPERVEITDYH
jgi:proteic killer suppression protein